MTTPHTTTTADTAIDRYMTPPMGDNFDGYEVQFDCIPNLGCVSVFGNTPQQAMELARKRFRSEVIRQRAGGAMLRALKGGAK